MSDRARAAAPKQDPKTGLWGFVVDVSPGPDGERRQARRRGFRTKREAQEALDILRGEVRHHGYVAPTNQTVREFLVDDWLPAVKGTLQPSSWMSYSDTVRIHIVPALGGIKLRALEPSQINRMYADLLADGGRKDGRPGGLSPRTVRYVHTVLGRALRDAVRWRRIAVSPVTAADPPRESDTRGREMVTWTGAELATFLAAERSSRYWIAWRLLATTGMRRGEALGARWSDLDLDRGTLAIRQTITSIDHKMHIASRTKTGTSALRRRSHEGFRHRQISAMSASGALVRRSDESNEVDRKGRDRWAGSISPSGRRT